MGKLYDSLKASLAKIEAKLKEARDKPEGVDETDIDTAISDLQQAQQDIALSAEINAPAEEAPVEELPEEEAPKA